MLRLGGLRLTSTEQLRRFRGVHRLGLLFSPLRFAHTQASECPLEVRLPRGLRRLLLLQRMRMLCRLLLLPFMHLLVGPLLALRLLHHSTRDLLLLYGLRLRLRCHSLHLLLHRSLLR